MLKKLIVVYAWPATQNINKEQHIYNILRSIIQQYRMPNEAMTAILVEKGQHAGEESGLMLSQNWASDGATVGTTRRVHW